MRLPAAAGNTGGGGVGRPGLHEPRKGIPRGPVYPAATQATFLGIHKYDDTLDVARSSKRGTANATYGYYTMGKLMILKLREDDKAKQGAQYSLQNFHDTFIRLGPLPLALVRKAMLGAFVPLCLGALVKSRGLVSV